MAAALLAAICLQPTPAIAQAITNIVNVADTTIDGNAINTFTFNNVTRTGAFIGDAIFRPNVTGVDPTKSGSGQFRDLYRISDSAVTLSNAENGYNRDGVFDASVPNGFDPLIYVSNLVLDASGQYYVFSLDINENKSGERYLSLDDFQIYVGGPTDPSPLPNTSASLTGLGTRVYAMNNSSTQSHILMDYSLNAGSGVQDLFVLVKKSLFTGFAPSNYVYVYSSFGQYSLFPGRTAGFDPSDGAEQWSIPVAFGGQIEVPEPSAIGALLTIAAGLVLHARRRRVPGPVTREVSRVAPKT